MQLVIHGSYILVSLSFNGRGPVHELCEKMFLANQIAWFFKLEYLLN